MDHSELLKLLAGLCNEGLSDAETARLEELLADTEARRVYLEYMDLEARLLTLNGNAARSAVGLQPSVAGKSVRPQPELKRAKWWAQPTLRYVAVAAASVAATMLVQ